ncbi:MAG: 4Fe-4S dicluster domain-containing protein [Deltaproteobacteria bacterium]|nr:4Fe-4S dicluster domain-containing protein [Deltaproteobacteria bacterium]
MNIRRRDFFKVALASAAAVGPARAASNDAVQQAACLVDTALCIGCRKCEEACNRANALPGPDRPADHRTAFCGERRPTDRALTVVNQYPGTPSRDQRHRRETYAKVQCMHCLDPACVSACIVGALTKSEAGPVRYDARICLGCRYCMVACPFEIPAYQYREALAPRVVKCEFCANTSRGPTANPACAEACPVEALVFGQRGDLLRLARQRIADRPDRYLDIIYGEREGGGTCWLYLVGRSPSEIGLPELPGISPARLTEKLQHTVFRYGALPLAAYGALGALMWHSRRREQRADPTRPADTGGRAR